MQELTGDTNVINSVVFKPSSGSSVNLPYSSWKYFSPGWGGMNSSALPVYNIIYQLKPKVISRIAFPNNGSSLVSAIVTLTPADTQKAPISYPMKKDDIVFTGLTEPISKVNFTVTEFKPNQKTYKVEFSLQSCSHVTTYLSTASSTNSNHFFKKKKKYITKFEQKNQLIKIFLLFFS